MTATLPTTARSPEARRVRALFVTPSELSSGEAMTVLQMAEEVSRCGGRVACLASRFTAGFLESRLGPAVTRLTGDSRSNLRLWQHTLHRLRPNIVVFADYPLLFFSNGTVPLADDQWVASLNALDAVLITLDHLGYAQRPMHVFFGPPHLSIHGEVIPALPASMRVLLPCPMNEPGPVPGRLGVPFRYLQQPRNGQHSSVPMPKAPDDPLLIVHTVPTWAWRIASKWHLPHYAALPDILERWLGPLPHRVRVISVNRGDLIEVRTGSGLEIVNSGPLAPADYDALIASADLILTDNAVSSAAGRSVNALTPVVRLHNSRRLVEIVEGDDAWARSLALAMERARPGAVFPFEVFPLWDAGDLDALGLFRHNSVAEAVEVIELFDSERSSRQLQELLLGGAARDQLRQRQKEYMARLARLPRPAEVLGTLAQGVAA
jgi:hypothetical protein